ncbi:alpha/beta hydrolase family protein [Actinomadura sp. HBU206391]|uniref:alpha/beta hydrolase family protein n=1 Tax=Actinomadura sp. HBU206391 TaxID=2731692 RepID=UPI001650D3E6|nr:alpha/beta hydrolase [Actinomadura sp. HBU206391]MBC6457478.1 alpha/beta hydrolase [Actinomadura sp. HBU206391]
MRLQDSPILRGGPAAFSGLLALAASAFCASAPAASASETASAVPASAVPASAGASATPSTTPFLPKPTGPHPVGTTSLHLKDVSRADPWVPAAKARELMVSLWYPAKSRGGRRAHYVTPKESELILQGTGITGVPSDALSRTRTNAFSDAKPAGREHTLPLVVLSPGFTWPRTSLTALAEDLASRGYAVAGIDHTYETFATTFPDGRVTTCAACEIESGDDFGDRAVKSRAADVSFVLDELTGSHPKWKGGTLIDPSRIAMAGSSLGGASAPGTMLADARVRAGINMDGTMFTPIPASGLSRPFLLLGQEAHGPGQQDSTWDRDWNRMTGWKRWLVVAGSVHASFTDYDMLAGQIGVDLGSDLTGTRSVEITRRYVRAFLDLHLRNKPQPLLKKASPRYPEVRFCTPETKICE